MTVNEAYAEAIDADKAWSAELRRNFGRNAGDVRYTKRGEGEPGSALNAAYLRFAETTERWRTMVQSA